MRILLTGGGTGGHVIPNIAIIKKLHKKPSTKILYIGSRKGIERKLIKDVSYKTIFTGKIRRYFSFKTFLDLFCIPIGIIQSFFHILKFKPDVIFAKGGYVSFPVVLAGRMLRVKIVIHESDSIPGLATKVCALLANKICLAYSDAQKYFPKKKTVLTGNPIREEILKGNLQKGLKKTGFNTKKSIVLIMGGSSGAAKINELTWESLENLLKKCQIIHICGKGKKSVELIGKSSNQNIVSKIVNGESRVLKIVFWPAYRTGRQGGKRFARKRTNAYGDEEIAQPTPPKPIFQHSRKKKLAKKYGASYKAFEYINKDLSDIYAICDLIISRAGANSVAEIQALGKPSILIPLSKRASRGEQIKNAKILEKKGGCVVLREEKLTPEKFSETIIKLLKGKKKMEKMGEKTRESFIKQGTGNIIEVLMNVL